MSFNEEERVWTLSQFDIDYLEISDSFKDLTRLAAKIAGTDISLINLIDSYTQWTIANYGLNIEQMPKEESVCQYTIKVPQRFEVKKLSEDERFKKKYYVAGEPYVGYYFGVPLTTSGGFNLGALCVLDKAEKELSPEKIDLLKIVAREVVSRLETLKIIRELKSSAELAKYNQQKVAHDIRGPLAGIIGLTKIINEQSQDLSKEEVLEFVQMIYKAGNSLLDLLSEILRQEDRAEMNKQQSRKEAYTIKSLKNKLEQLYSPQAHNKDIVLKIQIDASSNTDVHFPKNKITQIIGNLVTNAIKFTPAGGKVEVGLCLTIGKDLHNNLKIVVSDTGIGLTDSEILKILNKEKESTAGTEGEAGFGFGLPLVKRLVDDLKGEMQIVSSPGNGTTFTVTVNVERI
jgi:signal transduction histidine kinase